MKTVNEVFTISNGIYRAIKDLYPEDYTYLFGEIESADMDLELLAKCGQRICAPVVTLSEEDPENIARLIMNRYRDNWRKIKDALSLTYDVLSPVVSGYTITKTGTTERSGETSHDEHTKVYGFDSTDGTNDTSNARTGTDSSTIDTQSTTTYNKRGVGTLTPNRLIESEISFRRLSFLNITLNDISQFITLSVY